MFTVQASPSLFARLEVGVFAAEREWDEEQGSAVYSAGLGIDVWWREDEARGWSVPLVLQAGYRHGFLVALGGGGLDLVLHDTRPARSGWGVLAPMVVASAGLDIDSVRILADVRVGWRWQWDADDLVQARLGAMVEVPFEALFLRKRRSRRGR